MSKTDELRAMLDERCVEYRTNDTVWAMFTEWISVYGKRVAFYENCRDKATFCMDSTGFTPEQAVAVTLESGDAERWRSVALGLFASLEEADLDMSRRWIVEDETLRKELAYGDSPAATPGPGTCEMVYGEDDHGVDSFWCQSCGHRQAATLRHTGHGNIVMPRFCQGCGREVTG